MTNQDLINRNPPSRVQTSAPKTDNSIHNLNPMQTQDDSRYMQMHERNRSNITT